jgi:hypothetical protein
MGKNKLIDFTYKPNSLNTENIYILIYLNQLCKLIVQINYILSVE